MNNPKTKRTFTSYLTKRVWTMIGGLGIIIALVSGLFAFDDRYAKCKDLDKMESESVKTFKKFRETQQVELDNVKKISKIQYLQLNYQWTQSQVSSLRVKLSQDRDNTLLMTEYQNLLKKESELKKLIDDNLMK